MKILDRIDKATVIECFNGVRDQSWETNLELESLDYIDLMPDSKVMLIWGKVKEVYKPGIIRYREYTITLPILKTIYEKCDNIYKKEVVKFIKQSKIYKTTEQSLLWAQEVVLGKHG